MLEGAEDPGVWHPWTAYGNWGMSRINLGVALFDNPDINEAASYEWQLHCRVIGTWGVGVTLGGGWGTNSGTGRLLSPGTIETGLALASTNVDIPLGRGRAPIISLGGGIGGYYVDPNVDSDLRDDLDAQNRRRDQGHYWFTDTRARADLLIPLDRKRYAFLGLGVARDWAEGDITATVRNTNTGATVSKRTERVNFDRTTYQLSLVVLF